VYPEQQPAQTRKQPLSGKTRKTKKPFDKRKLLGPLPLLKAGQRLATLFPHGWNWIYSDAPKRGIKPEWETVKKFPLAPVELWSLHQDENCIIGIRPDKDTRWGILDIDITSPYHPQNNPEALPKILATLEDIGIVRTLLCQSSHSGGLHLYLPLPEVIGSYGLAVALKMHLSAAGFKLRSGQLETFPNVKRYVPQGQGHSSYNGVRLPFQPHTGFIVLDADLTPLPWNLDDWLDAFDLASSCQNLTLLKRQIADAKLNHRIRKGDRTPQSLESWQERIKLEKQGWSGPGETNEKLKAFACEARVFLGMDSEDQLAQYIEKSAQSTPGFQEHSSHQKNLKQRSRDVAAWAMKYYWPMGGPASRETGYHGPQKSIADFSYHQAKREAAQHRIREAIAQLQQSNTLPATATARAKAIVSIAKVSQHTLYKAINKSLWHPDKFPTISPIKIAESQALQPITQPQTKPEKNATLKPLQPSINKGITQLLFKVGFVILYLLTETVVASALKGQKVLRFQAEHLDRKALERESAIIVLFVINWSDFKALLSESFQRKLTQAECQRKLDQVREHRGRHRSESRQLLLTAPSSIVIEASPEHFFKVQQKPYLLMSFVQSLIYLEFQQRLPTVAEQQEFETWYALAEQFKLVTDYHWENREYWVESNHQWHSYCELSGTFTIRRLQQYLSKLFYFEGSILKDRLERCAKNGEVV
jgi:hypothetical protein